METSGELYCVEAYEVTEHWPKKYGAIKVPAVYAPEIMGLDPRDFEFSEDPYVYKRVIKSLDEMKPKTIFGFHTKEMLDQMMQEDMIDRQAKHIQYLLDGNTYNKLLKHPGPITRYKALMNVFYYIEDSYTEANMFQNLTPETVLVIFKACQEAISLANSTEVDEYEKEDLEVYADSVQKIVTRASIIVPHKICFPVK